MSDPLRLVWAYDRQHLRHPFIVLGLNSFAHAGLCVTVVSSDKAMPDALYDSEDAFSFRDRERNWKRSIEAAKKIRDRRAAAKDKAQRLAKAAKKAPSRAQRWIGGLGAAALGGRVRLYEFEEQLGTAWAKFRRDTLDTWLPYLRGFRRLISSRPMSSWRRARRRRCGPALRPSYRGCLSSITRSSSMAISWRNGTR